MTNRVILKGFIASEPLIRATERGRFASLRVASIEHLTNSRTGMVREHTEWHNVTMYGDNAILIDEHTRLGTPLEIEGALRTREWTDRAGIVRKTTEISATSVKIVDSIEGCTLPRAIQEAIDQESPQIKTTPPPTYEVKAPAPDPDELPF